MDERPELAAIRRLSWWCVGCAAQFTLFSAASTQARTLRDLSPWQDDPYDGVVSFTHLLVPALALVVAIRTAGRRPGTAPRDLLRGGRALIGMVAVTAATAAQ